MILLKLVIKTRMEYVFQHGQTYSTPVTSKPLTITNLFLPETHPLFNYGIITDVYLESGKASNYIKDRLKPIFNQKLVDLYYELVRGRHNNK